MFFFKKSKKHECFLEWTGDYSDWKSAEMQSEGYGDVSIVERVKDAVLDVKHGKALWERDSVCFFAPQFNWPVLASLLKISSNAHGVLRVLDFGGALGSFYWQHRAVLDDLKQCSWHIVEQESFVQCGLDFFADDVLHFHLSIEEALLVSPNVILLSGVLPYIEYPYELLQDIVKTNLPVILDRTYMYDDHERITVQHVPESIYKASYPCRFLNKSSLESIFSNAGYTLSPWFQSAVDPSPCLGVFGWKKNDNN